MGIFPVCLKNARVIPIFKSGDAKSVKNYRPISMLPFLSKVFERLMSKRLNSFLTKSNILCSHQFGFRKNSCTSDAILEFLDNTYSSLDRKENILAVFLDFSKAFDTVNHEILLLKMNHLGIRGNMLSWFRSYLHNRRQKVFVAGHLSEAAEITMGVPQGSVLGPILFLLYINDMSRSSSLLKFVHFADDTTVFFANKCMKHVHSVMNEELIKVDEWLKSNRLSLNVSKTSYMLVSHNANVNDANFISIRGNILNRVNCVKFLGVLLDDKLNFTSHVNNVATKISKSIGVIRRVSHLIQSRELLNFVLCTYLFTYNLCNINVGSLGVV